MSYIYKADRDLLLKQIKQHAHFIHGRVLDIGAGNLSRYKHLFSFEKYETMDVEEGKNIDIVGKIEVIPATDNSYDSIVCTQVLGDVFELEKAFSEMFRVLKPGGIVLITESLFDPLHDEPNDYWRFTEHSLRKLALDASFKIEVLQKRGGYHSVMTQLRSRYWIERLHAHKKWYARLLSFKFKILGKLAHFLDRQDKSHANKIFTHGFILIAKKHA